MASKLIMSGFLIRRLFQALNPSVRFLCLEGPARSAKTVEAIEIFFRRVYNSSQKYHCIASQTYETARDNIIEADTVGLTFTHPNVHWCGKNLTLIGADGKKKVIKVCGFLDAARWKKILGGTIENFLIDEINVANETFIDECFARQLSCEKPFMICTLNGDDPDHFVYQKYINYAKIIGDCPESTRKLVKEFQERNPERLLLLSFQDERQSCDDCGKTEKRHVHLPCRELLLHYQNTGGEGHSGRSAVQGLYDR